MPPVFSKPLSFGNIYCIYNDNLTNCYIGSTFDYEQRMEQHNKVCVNIKSKSYNFKVYKYIRGTGGFQKWKFKIIEEVVVSSRIQLNSSGFIFS